MSDFKQKNNTAYLHKNKFKNEDKHPSYRVKAIINGTKKVCSLWYNKEKDYFFLGFSDPYKKDDLPEGDIKKEPNEGDNMPF